MIIILEGADGVGKSTLADALEAYHSGPVLRVNNGPPPGDVPPYLHYSSMLDDLVDMVNDDKRLLIVVDRFHVGELIYAPMFRGTMDLSLDEARAIDYEIMSYGACPVHCWLPYDEIIRRQIARDGGRPDEKSGAGMGHAHAIRRAFMWACGDGRNHGALTPAWMTLDMRGYPDQLASFVIDRAMRLNDVTRT